MEYVDCLGVDLRFPDLSFDAVVCVFGIFFVPDMAAPIPRRSAYGPPAPPSGLPSWAGSN